MAEDVEFVETETHELVARKDGDGFTVTFDGDVVASGRSWEAVEKQVDKELGWVVGDGYRIQFDPDIPAHPRNLLELDDDTGEYDPESDELSERLIEPDITLNGKAAAWLFEDSGPVLLTDDEYTQLCSDGTWLSGGVSSTDLGFGYGARWDCCQYGSLVLDCMWDCSEGVHRFSISHPEDPLRHAVEAAVSGFTQWGLHCPACRVEPRTFHAYMHEDIPLEAVRNAMAEAFDVCAEHRTRAWEWSAEFNEAWWRYDPDGWVSVEEPRIRRSPKGRLDRYRGCLLGGAVGDALGAPVEFDSWGTIRDRYGPAGLADYAEAYGRRGAITDDTQMTLFTASGLLQAVDVLDGQESNWSPVDQVHVAYREWHTTQMEELDPERVEYRSWLFGQEFLYSRRAPGTTCMSALASGERGTRNAPLNDSMGCGGVMRAAPVGLLLESPDQAFEIGCDIAAVTHGNPDGWLPAGALAAMVSTLVRKKGIRAAVAESRAILERHAPDSLTAQALDRAVALADAGRPGPEDLETLGGGWVGHEALAIAVCCALTARGNFRRGVLAAVNHSGDSDSTGAICGNLLGVAYGESIIPQEWIADLEGADVIAAVADDLHAGRGGNGRRYPWSY